MFVFAWTPYAISSMYTGFIAKNPVNFYATTIPGIFAKLSIIWCPLIDILYNDTVKQTIGDIFQKIFVFESTESDSFALANI
jgi:hypothetical protein